MKIRYYISGHGLGHASRSCQIIATLRRRHSEVAVEVVSDAHPWFFTEALDPKVPVTRRTLDIGVLQRDSLEMDEAATLRACRELLAARETLVAEEAASLRAAGVNLVAADIPALPFAAAARAGIPSVGISNFTWDWIYEAFLPRHPGYGEVVEAFRADYARADLLLRLPFHGPTSAFGRVDELPLVTRRGTLERAEVRRRLGIPEWMRVALLSFGGFGLREIDFAPLAALSGWTFLGSAAPAAPAAPAGCIRAVPPGLLPYPDLVRAADAVVTKPGYGIVSECLAAGTPVLYTLRGAFAEQPLLVAALHRYGRAREIGNERLRSGDWGADLAALLAQPQPQERLATDGDVVAADRLAALAGGGPR